MKNRALSNSRLVFLSVIGGDSVEQLLRESLRRLGEAALQVVAVELDHVEVLH